MHEQDRPQQDPFDALALPGVFGLTPAQIESAYLKRAASLHPDLAGDEDAALHSSALNEAKATLLDPESRARALLARLGGDGPGDPSARTALPDGFLMEIMSTRQQIEADLAGPDADAKREKWEGWGEERRREHIEHVAELFESAGEHPSPERLGAIRTRLNAWRYIERLIEQLDPDYDPAGADFSG
ncbi:MAG: DnaJ domain-containing protein [Phycisphaerales bacterium JB040]